MSGAHGFIWHGTGQSLLEAKLVCLAAAQSSVAMETFIFRDSDVGRQFRDALTSAARRGVQVRLLVDAIGSFSLPRDYFDSLAAQFYARLKHQEVASFGFRFCVTERPGTGDRRPGLL